MISCYFHTRYPYAEHLSLSIFLWNVVKQVLTAEITLILRNWYHKYLNGIFDSQSISLYKIAPQNPPHVKTRTMTCLCVI